MLKKYFVVGLVSLSVIAAELFWTRLFSAEFYYTFAFLILSLAVLGLGLGAFAHRMFDFLKKGHSSGIVTALAGICAIGAVPATFALNLDFAKLISEPTQILKLISAIAFLSSSHFFAGIALARYFSDESQRIAKIYTVDMISASLGVILFILLMNNFGGTAVYALTAIPLFMASAFALNKFYKAIPLALGLGSVLFINFIGGVPEAARKEPAKVVYKHWDAASKIKIYEFDKESKGINIDNIANTPVYKFDGNYNIPDSLKGPFGVDVKYLVYRFKNCRFLSLGSGGGGDVLQALLYGATEVHAVEVNSHINYLMKEGNLREFSGNIYNDKRVKVISDDARSYVRGFENKFDIIYSLSSNSWAAFASGAFALAENYLFTTEAFVDYWKALSDEGFLSIEHQFYAPRLLSEALDAMKIIGVKNPEKHIAVYNLPQMRRKLLLISKRELTYDIINNAYGELTAENSKAIHLLYPAPEKLKNNIYAAIVANGWRSVADTVKVDVSPCTDDKPFIAQLGLMKNLNQDISKGLPLYEFTGFPLAKVITTIILIVALLLSAPIIIVPYFKKGPKPVVGGLAYFFLIGMAYMGVETVFVQKFTGFIGSPVYSFALILAVMLSSSALGSYISERIQTKYAFALLLIILIGHATFFTPLLQICAGFGFEQRILIAALLISPVGLLMGIPFPIAVKKIGTNSDWGFAVNGVASVVGSALTILVAFNFGYAFAIAFCIICYALAAIIYNYLNNWNYGE